MEAISEILQPYKEVIGGIAGYLTILQFFSGAFICRDIMKKGGTKDISAVPFVGGIMMGLAMLKYGQLLQDAVMLQVNVAAIGLNILYSIFYYFYSSNKWDEILKPFAISMALVAVLWGYCEWENPSLIENRYGLIVTILMLLLLGSPLRDLKEIIKKKDASQIPFVMTLMATLVTFSWLLYAVILMNDFMLIQNVVGFALCVIQLLLIFAYPGNASETSEKKND